MKAPKQASPATRQELVRLASSRKTRRATWTEEAPTFWNPFEVYDQTTQAPFTNDGAWLRIARELAAGCPLEQIVLDKPPGKAGYVFHFRDAKGMPIYVKLQIASGQVRGRSFHIDRGKR